MPTYRLVLAYDGGGFRGFATQPGAETVQGSIEAALTKVCGQKITTTGAARTDAGVHALGQVMSFRVDTELDTGDLLQALNSICRPEIAIFSLDRAPDGFDARFSAEARSYEYAIFNRRIHDPFSRHTTWHIPHPLDHALMAKAAEPLPGEHAFDSFGRVFEGKPSVRRLESIEIEKTGDLIAIRLTANSFLQQMVRSIVGTLVKAGEGKLDPAEMDGILHAKDRSAAGPVAPPHGLFLVSVTYPEELLA